MTIGRWKGVSNNFNKAEGDDECLKFCSSEMECNCAMKFNKGLFRPLFV
jgi:hypothetical protein